MALRDRTASPAARGHPVASSREELVTRYRARLLEEVDLEEVTGLDLPPAASAAGANALPAPVPGGAGHVAPGKNVARHTGRR